MAMTPEEIDALPDYTTAQQLKLLRRRKMLILEQMQEGGGNGRSARQADFTAICEEEKVLEQKLADEGAGEAGGGNVLVRWNDAT